MTRREQTRVVHVGGVAVGGGNPIPVQSMTKTDTRDVAATLAQIRRLAAARCRIVRVAVPDQEAAQALAAICRASPLPVVADIHFDHRLAVAAADAGAAGLRINPGNIGARAKVAEVVAACRAHGIPIRVGVNAGSLPRSILARHSGPTAEAMVEAALAQVEMLAEMDFRDVKVSLKASDAARTAAACLAFAEKSDLPQHVGVTEAGSVLSGAVRSAIGIGQVLAAGVGDTIRVSLAGDPVQEVRAGYAILAALGLDESGVRVIACPTCGRLAAETLAVVAAVEEATGAIEGRATVAVMGCTVNGPGEAREADIGVIVAGPEEFLLYVGGTYRRRVARAGVVPAVLEELSEILANRRE